MGTLHPQFEERVCRWDYRECVKAVSEYSADEDVFVENWKGSALFHLLDTGKNEVRRRIGFGDSTDFYGLKSLREAGHTDFVAIGFHGGGPDCERGQPNRRALPRAVNRHPDVLDLRSVAGCDQKVESRIGGLSLIARRFQVDGTVLAQELGTAIRIV
ncbi:hypothetical protein [Rhizobium mongolense]|uniref:hypothetical protein n=1 Tax=Rhizobium mongolense TaxID=57676 RepID=UPI0034A4AEE2